MATFYRATGLNDASGDGTVEAYPNVHRTGGRDAVFEFTDISIDDRRARPEAGRAAAASTVRPERGRLRQGVPGRRRPAAQEAETGRRARRSAAGPR